MEDNYKRIIGLSDEEFLSFLYSERDRENSLNNYQGWNNWVLIGTMITLLYTIYSMLEINTIIEWLKVGYYMGGIVAFLLAYRFLIYFLKIERGYDNSRVKLLKNIIPWTDVGLVIVTCLSVIILILLFDKPSQIFWLWSSILILQCVGVVAAIIKQNDIVPSYYDKSFISNYWLNAAYNIILAALMGVVFGMSFETNSWSILCSEFKMGALLSLLLFTIYLLITINVENKVIRKFEPIIDEYVYSGASKEKTFQSILKNRMGYGVFDVCIREYETIKNRVLLCKEKSIILNGITNKLKTEGHTLDQLSEYLRTLDSILKFSSESLIQARNLLTRINKMLKIVPIISQFSDLKVINKTTEDFYKEMKGIISEVKQVQDIIEKMMTDYRKKINDISNSITIK